MRTLPLLLFVLLWSSTSRAADDPVPPLVAGNTRFACDLYQAVRQEEGNLFLSPYSVSVALAMTREGARGDTAKEMDAVLGLPSEGVGDGFERLARALAPPEVRDDGGTAPAYALEVANALWGQSGYAFEPDFGRRVREGYAAAFEALDFRQPEAARRRINDWVAQRTKDRIQDLLPEGMPTTDTRLVLTNAVYFKAPWADPFPERATQDGPFTLPGGDDVQVPLMGRTGRYRYFEDEGVQVLWIPYREHEVDMLVVLPRAKDGLPPVELALAPAVLDAWTQGAAGRRVALKLPRFTFTRAFDLTRVLPRMGMLKAFEPFAADFSGIAAKEPLYIGAVIHKAFVAVDEKGTEAAAATAVGVRAGSAPRPEEPVVFTADHPFLFLLRHRDTGTVLFLGRVLDPRS
jgi:serpin B